MKKGVRHRVSLGKVSLKEGRKIAEAMNVAVKAPTFDRAVEILRMFYADEENAVPLMEAWGKYLEMATAIGKAEISSDTLNHRRQHLSRFTEWLGETLPRIRFVEDVTKTIAADYATHLANAKGLKGQQMSLKARKGHFDDLKAIWKVLANVSNGVHQVWDGLSPTGATVSSVRREVFTEKQEKAVMDAARRIGKGWPLACLIARHTGLRYGSVANLEWSEFDLEAGVLNHTPRKTARHGIVVHIPIVKVLLDALKAEKRGDSPYVLPNHAAVYGMNKRARQKELPFREVLDAAGITGDEYTFHSWRHTAASRLSAAGADKDLRKSILGHTTDEMAERYNHDERMAEKRKALEAAAGAAVSG